ncbi:MAG: site-specific integrase [Tannerella sp.]|jgi:integrase|nr:site-specific integrase [Tannerella sp.]
MNIKRHCQFLLDKEPGKPDAKLRYRIKWNNSKIIVSFNVGYRINVDKWSLDTQRCKNNTTHGKKKVAANIINREIQVFEQWIDNAFEHFEKMCKTPSRDEFRTEFNRQSGRSQTNVEKSIFNIFDDYVRKVGATNSWELGTYTRYNSTKAHLLNFDGTLTFDSLTEEKLFDFVKYMQSERSMQLFYKNSQMGMRNTTVAKNLEHIKEFLRWSKNNGHYVGNLHETFKMKLKGSDGKSKEVIYLSWDELIRLYAFRFEKDYLDRVRDVFCFLCFTSLRYSDAFKLKRSDVRDDHIKVVTKKTVDGLKIDLNKYSRSILDKYKNEVFPDDRALPVISNAKMNDYVKIIGSVVGFDEPTREVYFIGNERHEDVRPKYELLTTHCGRRTFIVNALFLGIPAEVVMSWTGHSDYDSMRPYIKIVDDLKNASMKKFDEKI